MINNKKRKSLNKNEKLKNGRGITLVALVVTIIVLIILAGVSISLVLGDNGIITKSQEAKENYQIAANEEQAQLANVEATLGNLGGTPKEKSEVEKYRDAGTYMTEKTTVEDSDGNLIEVPEGFKIAEDSGINVTEGIVIEDNDIIDGIGNNRGNQYVWIPVGEGIKTSDGTVDITLGRYVFADGTNHMAEDGVTPLAKGTPILMQNIEDYDAETEIHITDIDPTSTSDYGYKELTTQRDGVASIGLDGENATALSILNFKNSVAANGGYYIARYEASYGTDGKANSKVSNSYGTTAPTAEGALWNYITELDAATACRKINEENNNYTVDLINSYAWDTAIVYIQKFSGDEDYSYQSSLNSSLSNTGNLAENVKDEKCKINDMASNTREWTTEYSSRTVSSYAYPCTYRGGSYDSYDISDNYTAYRYNYFAKSSGENVTFRPALYM